MKTAGPRPPMALRVQVGWDFLLRGADEKRPGLDRKGFIQVGRSLAALSPPTGGTSLFPAKREVKREVGKAWQAWPGNQTSWKSLVRSLVGRGWGKCSEGRQIRIPLGSQMLPTRIHFGPILPFLDVFGHPGWTKRRGIPICPQVARSAGNSA